MKLVVKIGGTSGVESERVLEDISNLSRLGGEIVIVHGGSDAANNLGHALGHPPRKMFSKQGVESRYTDQRSMEIVTMALNGKVKPELVNQLLSRNVNAVGLCAADANMVLAVRKAQLKAKIGGRLQLVRDDCSGRITSVDTRFLTSILSLGVTPVLSPPARDPNFGPVNVDADRLAAKVAVALGAERLVFVSDVAGLLRDATDPLSVIGNVGLEEIDWAMALAKGRMKQKIMAVKDALAGGVPFVHIANGRADAPITNAVDGDGTLFGSVQVSKRKVAAE